jgi:hypothetical protein
MDLKQLKLTAITALAGVAVGYFLLPHKTKIETREVVKVEVKEVVKEKKNTVTKIVHVKDPSGAETDTTTITDTGVIDTVSNSTHETLNERIVSQNGISLGVYALSDIKLKKPDYGVLVDVPVASKVSVFLTGDTEKRIGAGIRLQF